jgi:hypothetical protein
MAEELASITALDVWELQPLPPGAKALPAKWVYRTKYNQDGSVDRYKARLVVKGFAQRPGVDFTELFAPVSRYATLRALLAHVAANDLELHQLDVKVAFLNGPLQETIFMVQPPGFERGDDVCRLKRALYGLRQAPRAWHARLVAELRAFGFTPSDADPCLFIRGKGEQRVFLLVYVDDILVAATSTRLATEIISAIRRVFAIHDMGCADTFLGFEITRDRPERKLYITQRKAITDLLERYGMADASNRATPLLSGVRLQADGIPLPAEVPYAPLVGSLMHLACCTRPDIAFAVGVLARHMASPTEDLWTAAKGVLRYLRGTSSHGLVYGCTSPLRAYCDADFGGDLPTRKSTTSFIFMLNGAAISWQSKLQPTVATSTTEAEYISASAALREVLWIRKVLFALNGAPPALPVLQCDNQAVLALIKDPVAHARTKHIDVAHHLIRERVLRGDVAFEYCASANNVADFLSKSLPSERFRTCAMHAGLGEVPSK